MEKRNIAEEILKIRFSQMIVNEHYKNGAFKIPIHLALGHEAVAIAIDKAMTPNDSLVLHHRNLHYHLARMKTLNPILDEYYLKKTGLAKGQLGAMNLASPSHNVDYTSSILGNNLGVATGLALSKKVKGIKGLAIVTTGDGSIEEGTFYESLLFAKSNDLPMLVMIENNEWSLATRIKERRCPIDIGGFAQSFGAQYVKLDGNDVFKYIDKLKLLREKAISENVPICVEAELTTLGYRTIEKKGYPDGKFINYHAGPAPTVNINSGPIIKDACEDPVFVLKQIIGDDIFNEYSDKVLHGLYNEIL